MVELEHRAIPPHELTQFITNNPAATTDFFDSYDFKPIKAAVKLALNEDQGGVCVYCECPLASTSGQVEHIKPKKGTNAHTHLCFTYTNYAHSCINPKTCGQKKKNGLLPIEPGLRCNDLLSLSTNGEIEPITGLTRHQKHLVLSTCNMLGLNKDSNLVDERQRWFKTMMMIKQKAPEEVPSFLEQAPYRYILRTAL